MINPNDINALNSLPIASLSPDQMHIAQNHVSAQQAEYQKNILENERNNRALAPPLNPIPAQMIHQIQAPLPAPYPMNVQHPMMPAHQIYLPQMLPGAENQYPRQPWPNTEYQAGVYPYSFNVPNPYNPMPPGNAVPHPGQGFAQQPEPFCGTASLQINPVQQAPPVNNGAHLAGPSGLPVPEINETSRPARRNERVQLPCNYRKVAQLTHHKLSVVSVKFSHCGKYLGTGSADKTIKIWQIPGFELLRTISNHKLGINEISWSSDSCWIASASDDKTVKIHSVDNGECVKTLTGHTSYVRSCTFNPQSSLIASAGTDENIRIWDVKTGTCVKTIIAHADDITTVVFNRTGSIIASSSYDGCIRIWDSETGACKRTLTVKDHTPVGFVKFTPNGKYVVSSTLDSTLQLWDFEKSKVLKAYTGHVNMNYSMGLSVSVTHGQYLIGGSECGRIFIWNIQTKEKAQVLASHKTGVLATDIHPTLNMFATAGLAPDMAVRVWSNDPVPCE